MSFRANRPKLCGNCAFPQNFHTRKLGQIRYFTQWTPTDCFKSLLFLKENNNSHSIQQYNSTLFAEFVQLLQGFEKVYIYLLIEEIIIGQITHLIAFHKPDLVLGDFNVHALRDSPLLDTMRQYGYTL